MYKKIIFCLTTIALSHGMLYCSENKKPTSLWTKTVNLGKDIYSRPFKKALSAGFFKGGKYALLFSSPVMIDIAMNTYSEDTFFSQALTGFAAALTGSALGTTSVLLPLSKKDFTKNLLPSDYQRIRRAGILGAHTGTFFGTALLVTHCIAGMPRTTKPRPNLPAKS